MLRNPLIHDLTGLKFGRLLVVSLAPKVPQKNGTYWECQCDCGNIKTIVSSNLKNGIAKSCGCLRRELLTSHGMTGTSEIAIWRGIIERCTKPQFKPHVYARYGGRGITVSKDWMTFENFLRDMGPRPFPGATVERKDNNKGYHKDNCRWATLMEQGNNRRNNRKWEVDGEFLTAREIMIKFNSTLNLPQVLARLKSGWNPKTAAIEPKYTHKSMLAEE